MKHAINFVLVIGVTERKGVTRDLGKRMLLATAMLGEPLKMRAA